MNTSLYYYGLFCLLMLAAGCIGLIRFLVEEGLTGSPSFGTSISLTTAAFGFGGFVAVCLAQFA